MKTIEKFISPLVQSQFPDFYNEQGQLFMLFVEEYYKWMESNDSDYASYEGALVVGNPLYHSRRLLDYKDIDSTVDEFLKYFKEKYFKNVPFDTNISKNRLIKATLDLFSSKGSERSFNLFFKLLYGTKIEIYNPGNDILKASDGTWVIPRYLEVTQSSRNASFTGRQIVGSISGALAFVEYVITRNVNGKIYDILFLSSIGGEFESGELVAEVGSNIINAPKVLGSLNTLDITAGGELFEVGETVKVISSSGVEGLARVTEVDAVTGIVRFAILDGGWGFSNTADTIVAEKTIQVSNINNTNAEITTFEQFETVSQNIYSFSVNNFIGIANNNTIYVNRDPSNVGTGTLVLSTQNTSPVQSSNSANLMLNTITNNLHSNSIFFELSRNYIFTNTNITFDIGSSVVQKNSSATNVTGIVNSISNVTVVTISSSTTNGVHIGTYVYQDTSDATGYVIAFERENNHTYTNVTYMAIANTTGEFHNTYSIKAYTNSTKATEIETYTPSNSKLGYGILLASTNATATDRWSSGNTVLLQENPETNNLIIFASDIGGKFYTNTDFTATGNIIATNTTHIGINNVVRTFYGNSRTSIRGRGSNTTANTVIIYTGSGADFNIGVVSDTETVRLSPDLISSNNTGGASSVKFRDMIITGANSTFGNLTTVYISNGGSGYDNTDVVVFTGGNSGVGSFTSGNATIVTDSSGAIIGVGLGANVGYLITTTPSVAIKTPGGSPSSGTGAELVPGSALGFVKLPGGDITTPLIDLLRFNTKTIGTIASLTSINPGENYNVDPLVLVYEGDVASYGKRDLILTYAGATGVFTNNEFVNQTITQPGVLVNNRGNLLGANITSGGTGYSNTDKVKFVGGNTGAGSFEAANAAITTYANGTIQSLTFTSNVGNLIYTTPTVQLLNSSGAASSGTGGDIDPILSAFEVEELVYSNNGITNTASGTIYSDTRNSTTGVHTTVLVANTGTWQSSINVSILTVSSNTNFEPDNNITQGTASGVLVTSNTTTLVIKNVTGTFQANATSVVSDASPTPGSTTISAVSNTTIFKINGTTSNTVTPINSVSACTVAAVARAKIYFANTSTLKLKRRSLFTEFLPGLTITGISSGASATVITAGMDMTTRAAGDNANIAANVVSSNGTIISAEVYNSGFAYVDTETVSLLSEDGLRSASARANVVSQGIGAGYYSSTRGFLDDKKYLFDGEYYQNFSYEIQTGLPFEIYSDVLKEILHVSGKKMFGKYVSQTNANFTITSNSTITAQITINPSTDINSGTDTISSNHGFNNNDIVIYTVSTGNTAISGLTNGTSYYVINTTNTSIDDIDQDNLTLRLSVTSGGSNINITSGLNQTGHTLTKTVSST